MASPSSSSDDVFISAGVNRSSHNADWTLWSPAGREPISVLAYGSSSSIAVACNLGGDEEKHTGLSDLVATQFTTPITTLKFIALPAEEGSLALVAGAGNGQAAVWIASASSKEGGNGDGSSASTSASLWRPLVWRLAFDLTSKPSATPSSKPRPPGTVQAIGVERGGQSRPSQAADTIVAIGSSDGTISIWSVPLTPSSSSKPTLIQTLHPSKAELSNALPLDIAIVRLPDSDAILMATAATDRKINFWLAEQRGKAFEKVLTLSGHDDWVRSLDFSAAFTPAGAGNDEQALCLASGSQDSSVRLWRVRRHPTQSSDAAATKGSEAPASAARDDFEALAKQVEDEAASDAAALSSKVHTFSSSSGASWAITFDALLTGHEGWVTGVRWMPPVPTQNDQPAALVSSSVDNSVILWTPNGSPVSSSLPKLSSGEATSSLWLPSHRFGELGVAGAGAMGMFGALFDPKWHIDGARHATVLSHAWAGPIHLWGRIGGDDDASARWESRPAVTAHALAVKSARWSPHGKWFLTASLDRTARVWAQMSGGGNNENVGGWHELARPQTHGYDLQGAAWLQDGLSFISAAEEKVARLFAAPQAFIESAKRLGASPPGTTTSATHNLLALSLPRELDAEEGSTSYLEHLGRPIREAAEMTCRVPRPHRLVIILSSPLFDSLCAGADSTGEALEDVSFSQMETLLRWTYAQAWGVAVQRDALLLDVDVLLVGEAQAPRVVRKWGSEDPVQEAGTGSTLKCGRFWAVKDSSAVLPFLLTQRPGSSTSLSPEFLRLGQPPSPPAQPSATPTPITPFPSHRGLALGGTFDHLHPGHKILLSLAALISTELLIVGITGDSMLAKKKHPELVESTRERRAAVRTFLRTFTSTMPQKVEALRYNLAELKDVAGPAGTVQDLQAMLLTEETVAGGDYIDDARAKRGLSAPLVRHVMGVLGAQGESTVKGESAAELAAAKVGSTAIRKWLSGQSERVKAETRRRMRSLLAQEVEEYSSKVAGTGKSARPMAASVPALGLSNRAVYEGQEGQADTQVDDLGRTVTASSSNDAVATPTSSSTSTRPRPPVEEALLSTTLWPEIDKLYGHGYELLCTDSFGPLVATSCRATSRVHCVVRVYDAARNWKHVGTLAGHSLSVTRIRFSPCGAWVLTVSRDRSWRLFQVGRRTRGEDGSDEGEWEFRAFAGGVDEDEEGEAKPSKPLPHTRIVWDGAWADDARTFATASRDKTVKVWRLAPSAVLAQREQQQEGDAQQDEPVTLIASVSRLAAGATAVAFDVWNRLAVGLDNGTVAVYQLASAGEGEGGKLQLLLTLPGHHSGAVNEVAWQPWDGEKEEEEASRASGLLLSAGEDGAVRLTRAESDLAVNA